MNPKPLLRIAPYLFLDYPGKELCIQPHFLLEISSSHQGHLRLESKSVLPHPLIPNQESRNYRRARAECKDRKTGGRTGGYSKEVAKHALFFKDVHVDQHAYLFVSSKGCEHCPGALVLVDSPVPGQSAIAVDHVINQRIIDTTHKEGEWIAIDAVRECTKLHEPT